MHLDKIFPLPALDFEDLIPPREIDKEYFRFYNIDFESLYPSVEHYFGSVSLAGYKIASHYFRQPDAKATLFIVHGYLDHVGLYRNIIEWGIEHQFSIIAFDLPGHGLSSGESVSINQFDEYRTVFDTLLANVEQSVPGPWHIVAQSTGGAIVMDYLLTQSSNNFKKIILLAPLVRPAQWRLVQMKLSIGRYFLGSVKRHFVKNSHNEKFLQFISRQDPLQSKRISVVWLLALKQWLPLFVRYRPNCEIKPLVIQGTDDQTVDWRYNIKIVKEKFPNGRLFELAGARHHLVNESQEYIEQIFQQMSQYVEPK